MANPAAQPAVFVIMPFDKGWDDHYGAGIKPACEAVGATCSRVDEQVFLQSIPDRIYNEIERADVVVAEMTGTNPNVFYEVGYAHGIGKPVILLTTDAAEIPFDLRHYPHVIHGRQIVEVVKPRVTELVRWCLENPEDARAQMRGGAAAERAALGVLADAIEAYLNLHHYGMVSFEKVRSNIDPRASDELLMKLIDHMPKRFRRSTLKGQRAGIGFRS